MAYNFIDYLLGRKPTQEDRRAGYFGDTMSKFGNDELAAAQYLLENAGTVAADSLPEEMGVYRNVLSYPADLVNAALLGVVGGSQKAAAGVAELLANDEYESRAARDILGGLEVVGVSPQGRAVSLLTAPAKAAVAARAPYLLSDVKYATRSLAEGDLEGVRDAFYEGGVPVGVGADAVNPAGEVMSYSDVEVLDPRDVIGATFSPTPADLTKTGGFYTGIDSSGTTRVTPLMGGPLFPLQETYRDAGVGWLVDSASKASTKLGKDADFLTVTTMSPKAHQSNASIADAYMGTLEAYIRDNRISDEGLNTLNNIVTDFGKKTKSEDMRKLSTFVGFDSPSFDDWMRSATFEQREMISKLMTSPKALKAGGPNFQRVLDETIQPEFAGSNLGDTTLVLKIDRDRGILDLASMGLPVHPSYDYGIAADVVGRFENPVSRGLLYSDFEDEFSSRPTMIRPDGTIDQSGMAYSFGRALPVEAMTPEKARNIQEAVAYYNIQQPQQAQVIEAALRGDAWRSSLIPKNRGGVGPTDYERAIERSPSSPSLSLLTAAEVKAGAKDGSLQVFQLGNDDIYFNLQKSPDYTWMNDGNPIPELGDNEIGLAGVINNELGAKGVAGPAILGKAIEEGVTVLDAFAVPSAKFPDGFLNSMYGNAGFEEVKRIPFSKEYYIEERGQAAYDDLLKQWRSEGWDESQGFPDVVLMKWRGTDDQRTNASTRIFDADFEGFGTGADIGSIRSSGQDFEQSLSSASGQQTTGQNIGSRNIGSVRTGNRTPVSNRLRTTVDELKGLTPLQRRNLGLLNM